MPTGCDVVIARENRHNAMFVLGTRPRELIIESSREHERNEREHTRLSTLLTQRGIVDLGTDSRDAPMVHAYAAILHFFSGPVTPKPNDDTGLLYVRESERQELQHKS